MKIKLLALLLIAIAIGWSVDYWRYRRDLDNRKRVIENSIQIQENMLVGNVTMANYFIKINPGKSKVDSTILLLMKYAVAIPKKEHIKLSEFPGFESLPNQIKTDMGGWGSIKKSLKRFIAQNRDSNVLTRLLKAELLSAINVSLFYDIGDPCLFIETPNQQSISNNSKNFFLNGFLAFKTYGSSELLYGNIPIPLPENQHYIFLYSNFWINTENL